MNYWAQSAWNPDREEDRPEESFARTLGKAFHKRIVEGKDRFTACYAPELTIDDCPGALRTAEEIRACLKAAEQKSSGNKDELIERLLSHDPTVKIFDVIRDGYQTKHEGKTFLPLRNMERIELAAAMIEKSPVLCKAFTGGMSEVSVFWVCERSGVPMKARFDYLKPRAIVDLKTFENKYGRPLDRAIATEMASYGYHRQAAMYYRAADEAVIHIKRGRVFGDVDKSFVQAIGASKERTFLYVFQQKGAAPVTRGRTLPRHSTWIRNGEIDIERAQDVFAQCLETYGTDTPWVDDADIAEFDDTEIPTYGLD